MSLSRCFVTITISTKRAVAALRSLQYRVARVGGATPMEALRSAYGPK